MLYEYDRPVITEISFAQPGCGLQGIRLRYDTEGAGRTVIVMDAHTGEQQVMWFNSPEEAQMLADHVKRLFAQGAIYDEETDGGTKA